MDEQNAQNVNNQGENQNPKPKEEGQGSGSQSSWQELAGVDPKEFDTPEKLAKSYKDARTGLADQGQKIKAAEDFQTQVSPVLKAIYGNPDLYKQVLGEVEKLYGKTEDPKKEDSKVTHDPRVDELSGITEAQIIKDFENETKINSIKDLDTSKVKSEIGQIMKRWLAPGASPSLQQLPTMLRDAWTIYKGNHNIQDEPEETPNLYLGFGTPRAIQSSIEKMDVGSLSPQERKAAEKMGLTPEEYLKEKKAIMSR